MSDTERDLSQALLRELAPAHADHYTGRLTVEVRTDCRPVGRDGCEDSLEVSIDADPSGCDCGEYLAGIIVARPSGGRANLYTEDETRALVSRLTGVRLR